MADSLSIGEFVLSFVLAGFGLAIAGSIITIFGYICIFILGKLTMFKFNIHCYLNRKKADKEAKMLIDTADKRRVDQYRKEHPED